jgi:outer membrane protein assembly factor BamD (BamD/ComL family)
VHAQDERVKLEACRAAMVARHWDDALALLDAHAQQFPRGDFFEERESLTIIAMDARGRHVEARARAERFSQTWPDSIFLPAIAAALQLSSTDSDSPPQEP